MKEWDLVKKGAFPRKAMHKYIGSIVLENGGGNKCKINERKGPCQKKAFVVKAEKA